MGKDMVSDHRIFIVTTLSSALESLDPYLLITVAENVHIKLRTVLPRKPTKSKARTALPRSVAKSSGNFGRSNSGG